jgi:hypothetical protein
MESTTRTADQAESIYGQSTIVKEDFKQNFKTYLINPLSNGMAGFAAIFSLILISKLLGYFLGSYETFNVGMSDVIYSLTGFVLGAGIKFFEFFGKED